MSQTSNRYDFAGQEAVYTAFRPNWNSAHALEALRLAGIAIPKSGSWIGASGPVPRVVSIGAGNGADAILFKRLGCDVALVEPNAALLAFAQQNLSEVAAGTATFINSDAIHSKLEPDSIDLIVVAQAAHTLKQLFAEKHLTASERAERVGTEELARRHWLGLLAHKAAASISIWYYNPDPRLHSTRRLHDLLRRSCASYAASQSPLYHADYFTPKHLQPWVEEARMQVVGPFEEQIVRLRRDQIGAWLSSYSFKPEPDEFGAVVDLLDREWFREFARDGEVEIHYIGVVVQGPIRLNAFPIDDIERAIDVSAPLEAE